jgi:hypothetical protein
VAAIAFLASAFQATLREGVREALDTELGKAVGQAVLDLHRAFARGRPVSCPDRVGDSRQ